MLFIVKTEEVRRGKLVFFGKIFGVQDKNGKVTSLLC